MQKRNMENPVITNKKIFAFSIIVILIIFSLSSCGGKQPNSEKAPAEKITSSAINPKNDKEKSKKIEEKESLPLKGLYIGIDAGHQRHGNSELEQIAPNSSEKKAKVTGGTSGVSSGLSEYELNLIIAKKLKKKLVKNGAKVLMSREVNNIDISNIERATMMNKADVDLVIRIHANGGGSSEKGAMMLIPAEGSVSKNVYKKSKKAGEIIFREYLNSTGANDLGVIPRSDLSGFNWLKVPGVLIEMGYMSNADEDLKMASKAYQKKIVTGLYKGVKTWAKKDSGV